MYILLSLPHLLSIGTRMIFILFFPTALSRQNSFCFRFTITYPSTLICVIQFTSLNICACYVIMILDILITCMVILYAQYDYITTSIITTMLKDGNVINP